MKGPLFSEAVSTTDDDDDDDDDDNNWGIQKISPP
jgi:hypothetical protein